LLVRAGAALPLGNAYGCDASIADTTRQLAIWPLSAGESCGMLFEDDGESHGWRDGHALWLRWTIRCDAERIDIHFEQQGDYRPAWRELELLLPPGEQRTLCVQGEESRRFTLA
jgi:alpha-glucosidase